MATLASLGGNFTAAASWALCDATAALDSEATSTALTTGNTDSTAFVPAAVAIDAVAIKLAIRAAGSPTNTITITLRNSTTATNVASVTINVSDLDVAASADHAGGWYFFKLASTHTPNGTDSYVVRATLSATTTAVSLWVSAGTNLSRQLRTTTTQAPAAGDKMIIGGEFTGAGTGNNITITMNNTTTTLFGVAIAVSTFLASISVGKRGTLTWGTTAATNYVLRMAGMHVIHSGGVVNMGTSGTPMPRDSSAILEFTPTTAVDAGIQVLNGGVYNAWGQSRTSGKDVFWTKLTSDAAAAATSLNVSDDTGWLSGDEIGIAATKRTSTQFEQRTLNAGAGASSLAITAGLTNAHDGSAANGIQAEIILLTRNVKIRSTDSTKRAFVSGDATSVIEFQWVEFQYIGETSGHLGIDIAATTGSFTLNKCSCRNFNGHVQITGTTANNFTITNNVFYSPTASTGYGVRINSILTTSTWSITGNIVVANSATAYGISCQSVRGTITNNIVSGCGRGLDLGNTSDNPLPIGSIDNNIAHTNAVEGIVLTGALDNKVITGWIAYRNASIGVQVTPFSAPTPLTTVTFVDLLVTANVFGGLTISVGSNIIGWVFRNMIAAGDSSFAQPTGILAGGSVSAIWEARFESCKFGVAEGIRVAHTTADINFQNITRCVRFSFWNSSLASATRFGNITGLTDTSYLAETKRNQTAGAHQTFWVKRGTIANDTTTTHSAGGAEKLTPATSTGYKLTSGSKRAAVASGGTVTFNVYVQKDGTYAGAAPRLILKANPAAGIVADVVLDTLSVGASTWEQLTGTSAAVTDDAVLEAVVDCDGSAGNVYVDDWTV